ncbi:MAG TPA: SAM-dependent methyltransferase, partial [Bacteroidales bacterium]|nr:SAM-dependent methyltransferase [Bacteroidales bacterium]
MNCRFCNHTVSYVFADLHHAPASNSFLTAEALQLPEVYFPLKVWVCHHCFLVQIDEVKQHEHIFDNNYIYFSSFSSSWLVHSHKFAQMATKQFNLSENSLVVEIASNDGYLLQYFKQQNIPCLGIEPTANTAQAAISKGIETITEFFGTPLANQLSAQGKIANLIVCNNVLAHVPDLKDFVQGLKIMLKPEGVISLEFPHILQLIKNLQFDTIYHEHFSYFSLFTLLKVFKKFELEIFDVEELTTHGGSLRIFVRHSQHRKEKTKTYDNIQKVLNDEMVSGLTKISGYANFQYKIDNLRIEVLHLFSTLKKEGKKIAAYGAAAKGNT